MLAPSVGGWVWKERRPALVLIMGCVVGSGILGVFALALSALAARLPVIQWLLLLVIVFSLGATAMPHLDVFIPQKRRQVTSMFVRLSRTESAFVWGIQLGLGVATFLVTPAIYAVVAGAALQPAPLLTLTVMITYGTARGTAMALAAWRHTEWDTFCRACSWRTGLMIGQMRVPLLAAQLAVLLTMQPI